MITKKHVSSLLIGALLATGGASVAHAGKSNDTLSVAIDRS